jgi:hypothetical protein
MALRALLRQVRPRRSWASSSRASLLGAGIGRGVSATFSLLASIIRLVMNRSSRERIYLAFQDFTGRDIERYGKVEVLDLRNDLY